MKARWQDDGGLWQLWREIKYQWSKGGVCELPGSEQVNFLALARWVYATHIEEEQWCPFVHINWKGTTQPHPQFWRAAKGGILFVETASLDMVPKQCYEMARRGDFLMLVCGVYKERFSPVATTLIQCAQTYHLVETDPDLETLRQGVLMQARHASTVHLSGALGGLMEDLIMWAHASLDGTALCKFGGDHGRLVPGKWLYFESIGQLSSSNRDLLVQQLLARKQRQRRGYHRLEQGERPRHVACDVYVGQSVETANVLQVLVRVAPGPVSVHLSGERGVGKQMLARVLHTLSGRPGDFVVYDDSVALDDQLRASAGGTFCINQMALLTMTQQLSLLKGLRRHGDDVRVVSSAGTDLERAVREGNFRRDLYGRLTGVVVPVAPLRGRLGDMDALFEHVLGQSVTCHKDVWPILHDYHWPGNVTELIQALKLAATLAGDGATRLMPVHFDQVAQKSRKVPLFTTSTGGQSTWGLDNSLTQQVRAVTFEVPAFRDRSLQSRLLALRSVLSGVLLTTEVLNTLVSLPWWGGVYEMDVRLTPLKSEEGVVDLDRLCVLVPDILGASAVAPIKVMLSPAQVSDEHVGGLTWDVEVGAVLIGRVSSWNVFESAALKGDERARAVCRLVSERCVGFDPWCLDLSFLRRLSRAHVLISQGEEGLEAQLLPGAGMRVEVESFEPGARALPLKLNQVVSFGEAGSLTWVRAKSQAVYLRLFVFSGPASYEQWSGEAAKRLSETTSWDMGTLNTQQEQVYLKPLSQVAQASHVWVVDPVEVEVLTDVLYSFSGGSLKRHITHALRGFEGDAEYERVIDFVRHVPRLSQYLGRLYQLPENDALREALSARFALLDDPSGAMGYLPKGVRDTLSPV